MSAEPVAEESVEKGGREADVVRRRALRVYGVATVLAVPHALPKGAPLEQIDLGLVFAWIVFPALWLAIEGLTPRAAAKRAFLASVVAHTVVFHWFAVVTVVYGHAPVLVGGFAPIVPALYVSLFTALFAWGTRWLAARGLSNIGWSVLLWVIVDYLRGHFMGGFPWATLGYSLHADWPLVIHTRFAGVYLLSFVAAAVGAAALVWWRAGRLRPPGLVTATFLVVVSAHAISILVIAPALSHVEGGGLPKIEIAVLQGNIDQGEKWSESRTQRILETYYDLSRKAAEEGAEWIVWPETALPVALELDAVAQADLALLAEETGATLVVGGMGVTVDPVAGKVTAFHDSAFVISPTRGLLDRYDKSHLVPFGEYVPLRWLIGAFFKGLATGLSSTDVVAGKRPRAVGIPLPAEETAPGADPVLAGIPICYELLFPHLVRRMGDDGARVLLAITNDAWYGRTGAPHQFLAMTALRAAENGRWLVRAANTGISAIIDSRGRVREATGLYEEGLLVATIPVYRRESAPTFYARHGDLFVGTCWTALAVGFIGVRRKPKRLREDAPNAQETVSEDDTDGTERPR